MSPPPPLNISPTTSAAFANTLASDFQGISLSIPLIIVVFKFASGE